MLGYVSQMQATTPTNPQGVNANPNFIPQQESPMQQPPDISRGVQIQPSLPQPQLSVPQNPPNQSLNDGIDYLMEETPVNKCIRAGCQNDAIVHSEWEDEYCSNECAVTHCKDVFNAWLAANQQNPTIA